MLIYVVVNRQLKVPPPSFFKTRDFIPFFAKSTYPFNIFAFLRHKFTCTINIVTGCSSPFYNFYLM